MKENSLPSSQQASAKEASAQPIDDSEQESRAQELITWGLVHRASNGLDYVHYLCIDSLCTTGPAVFISIREASQSLVLPGEGARRQAWRLGMHRPVVYIAKAIQAPASLCAYDEEALGPHEVFIVDQQRSKTYTQALRDPSILDTAPNFIANRCDYDLTGLNGQVCNGEPFPVLLIIREVDSVKMLLVFTGVFALSIGTGCAVGLPTHNTDLGVGIASGMISFLAILQFICLWISS